MYGKIFDGQFSWKLKKSLKAISSLIFKVMNFKFSESVPYMIKKITYDKIKI